MRVFQSSYKDRQGQTTKTLNWYVEFTDHREIVRRVPAFSDKKQSENLGRRIVELVTARASRGSLSLDMTQWIESMPASLRKTLGRYGLLDTAKVAAMRPLVEHIDGALDAPGWRQFLLAKGNTAKHVDLVCGRARRVVEGCKFLYWSDVSASRVMSYLADLHASKAGGDGTVKPGKSAQTFNFYLAALKGFCRWMVKDGRASESPVAHLDGLNVKTDKRHERRALDVEEIRWLLDTTARAGDAYGMTGLQRAMLYRLALETGLRVSELASLTRSSFNLDAQAPTVTVQAGYSKHRRQDVLPLRAETAADLADFLACKMPHSPAFDVPPNYDTADMLRFDLAAARAAWLKDATTAQENKAREDSSFLKYADCAGRVVDFHALRHTCGSLLASSGAHPKVAQSIMRHSSIELTMSRYTHVFAGQEADAIAAMPDFGKPAKQSAKATGTDNAKAAQDAVGRPTIKNYAAGRLPGRPAGQSMIWGKENISANVDMKNPNESGDSVLPVCLALQDGKPRIGVNQLEQKPSQADNKTTPMNIDKKQCSQGFSSSRLAGLEPTTCGLEDRCSIH
jgi:integrase